MSETFNVSLSVWQFPRGDYFVLGQVERERRRKQDAFRAKYEERRAVCIAFSIFVFPCLLLYCV